VPRGDPECLAASDDGIWGAAERIRDLLDRGMAGV
jgi:hypothetical protein